MKRSSLDREASAFAKYLAFHLSRPEGDEISSQVAEFRVPLAWRLLAMLMADFHLSKADAMDMEVAFALVLWAAESDRRGVCKVASERQRIFRAWVAEQEAARLAESASG